VLPAGDLGQAGVSKGSRHLQGHAKYTQKKTLRAVTLMNLIVPGRLAVPKSRRDNIAVKLSGRSAIR
jgi:hypothetical protein